MYPGPCPVRLNPEHEALQRGVVDGARLSFSMWQGYPRDDHRKRVIAWLAEKRIPMDFIHTSGHASPGDLRRFAGALSPRMLVPIHSFEGGLYAKVTLLFLTTTATTR